MAGIGHGGVASPLIERISEVEFVLSNAHLLSAGDLQASHRALQQPPPPQKAVARATWLTAQ
eukprot:12086701-Alexandrium_andersonii.AAC.1